MTKWKVASFLFAGLFATSLSMNMVQKSAAEPQPHMHSALHSLEAALAELKTAEHDKGGWRAAAVKSTEAAIVETKRGIAFDNRH
jgi:hypothetical protein